MFRRRKNDYEKSGETDKTLLKKFSHYSKTKASLYGSSYMHGLGPHKRQGKNKEKTYYIARHEIHEYFAVEILNRIGFNTPKSRIIDQESSSEILPKMASKTIDDYIPIMVFIHERSDKQDVNREFKKFNLLTLHEKYKLDIERQVIIDLQSYRGRISTSYKLVISA